MARIEVVVSVVALVGAVAACTPTTAEPTGRSAGTKPPSCVDGRRSGDEVGVDCGGSCAEPCKSSSGVGDPDAATAPPDPAAPGRIDGVKDGAETDVDCGGPDAPRCTEGQNCLVDGDCEVACDYAKRCVSAPSCKGHLGGDTCGEGEVGSQGVLHESCCRSLEVPGYEDPAHPGKIVYLDKYEITAGRVRAWLEQLAAASGGVPDVKSWIAKNRPAIWDRAWEAFLPSDWEGGTLVIARRLLGDPRPEDSGYTGPPPTGVILPPPTDMAQRLGANYQFGTEIYVDLHGSDCGTWPGTYGFSTYYYPADVLGRNGQNPRADGTGYRGEHIPAKELLDAKAMSCITNVMMAAFCAWDGGQLATDEVLDYVTATPSTLGNISGCGTQYDNHGELLGNVFTHTVQSGGRCPPVQAINATFDAGDQLPVPGPPLNEHHYWYPDLGNQDWDKAWEISAPGRASLAPAANGRAVDAIRINPGDEPWMDLAGNLSEAALDTNGGRFTGLFALKYRGIGYGSSRSDLNMTLMKGETILRIQRPEAKAAYIGGRCMRFM